MSFDTIDGVLETVANIQRRLNQNLRVLPLALTLYDSRNRLDAEVAAELRARHDVLNTVVRRRVRIKEDFAARVPCNNEDLRNLSLEIMEHIRNDPEKVYPVQDQERGRDPPRRRPRP
jgi:cellulose biosynthesis protein BcsQ